MSQEIISKELIDLLTMHEGIELKPYMCPANRLTIGIGRNLEDCGITLEEAEYLLMNDLKDCIKDLRIIFPKWHLIETKKQHALIDMRFNLGGPRFRRFKKMIKAVDDFDWANVAKEMEDSLWFRQVGERAKRLQRMIIS